MALKFDGTNDTGSVALDLSQWSSATACYWVDLRSTATDIIAEHSATAATNNGGFGFYTNDGATNTVSIGVRGTGVGGRRFPFTVNSGWHHVAWRFSSSPFAVDAGFLDGISQSLTAFGSGGGSAAFRNDTLYFGARGGSTFYFDGGLADFMLFPGEYLSDAEIQEIARGMMPQRQPYLRAFASDNPFQPSNGSLIQRPIVWTGGGPAEMDHPSIIEYEPLVRGRFGPSAGGGSGFQSAWARGANTVLVGGRLAA